MSAHDLPNDATLSSMPTHRTKCRREHRRLEGAERIPLFLFALHRRRLGPATDWPVFSGDVNVDAIPLLCDRHRVVPTEERMIGGDAPKNLVIVGCDPKNEYDWAFIAKKPRREGPRECVTEYLIACLGQLVPVALAEARLVRLPSLSGADQDVRFMSRRFTGPRSRLVHGVEIVARALGVERAQLESEVPKQRERLFYTVDTLVEILDESFPSNRDSIVRGFARMIAFDALVGCQDRHPMNWGVLEHVAGADEPRFAPIYDAARGLFWNHSDAQLLAKASATGAGGGGNASALRQRFLEAYAERCFALISPPGSGGTSGKTSHFDLVGRIMTMGDERLTSELRRVVRAFCPPLAQLMLRSRFGALLSPLRIELIGELLHIRHARLKRLCE